MTSYARNCRIARHIEKNNKPYEAKQQARDRDRRSRAAVMPPGHRCCIVGCMSSSHSSTGERYNNGLKFYRIPKVKTKEGKHVEEVTARRRRAWIAAISRPNITFESSPEGMRVCSRHFHSGAHAYEMKVSDPDWAPSLHLGHNVQEPNHLCRKRNIDRAWVAQVQGQKGERAEEEGSVEHGSEFADPNGSEDIKVCGMKTVTSGGSSLCARKTASGIRTKTVDGLKNCAKKDRSDIRTAGGNSKTHAKKGTPVLRAKSKVRGDVCCAVGCCNGRHRKNGADKSFFHFPREEMRCAEWLKNMGRKDLVGKSPSQLRSEGYKICSVHFKSDQFSHVGKTKTLTRSAVPTVFRAHKGLSRWKKTDVQPQGKQKDRDQGVVPEVKVEIDLADDPMLLCSPQDFSSPGARLEDPDHLESVTEFPCDPWTVHLNIKSEPVWEIESSTVSALTSHTIGYNGRHTERDPGDESYLRSAPCCPDERVLPSAMDCETMAASYTQPLRDIKLEPVDGDQEGFSSDADRKMVDAVWHSKAIYCQASQPTKKTVRTPAFIKSEPVSGDMFVSDQIQLFKDANSDSLHNCEHVDSARVSECVKVYKSEKINECEHANNSGSSSKGVNSAQSLSSHYTDTNSDVKLEPLDYEGSN